MTPYKDAPARWEKEGAKSVSWKLERQELGDVLEIVCFNDVTVQVDGAFGVRARLGLEGSNNREVFMPLEDALGLPVEIDRNRLVRLPAVPRYIRPVILDGDAATAINVTIFMRRLS